MLEEARTRRLAEINSGFAHLMSPSEALGEQIAPGSTARAKSTGRFGVPDVYSSTPGFVCGGRANGDEHVSRSSLDSIYLGARQV